MNLSKLASSAALIALIAGAPALTMVSSASAQETAPSAATEMPALLQGLDLQDLETETGRDGQREYEGKMADGTEIEADFDMAGNLIKIEADDGVLPAPVLEQALPDAVRNADAFALLDKVEELHTRHGMLGLKGEDKDGAELRLMFDTDGTLTGIATDDAAVPQDLIDGLLPQAVRDADVMGQFAVIDHVMTGRDRIMLSGQDADGEDMRAQLDQDGNVLRFGRGDDKHDGKRGGKRGDHEMRGDHKGHGEHGGKHGGKRDGDHVRGPRHDGEGMHGKDNHRPRAEAPDFDVDAVNKGLEDAGYSDLGKIRRAGPGAALRATNPDGESVVLHLDPKGEVVRETAR